MDREAQTAEMNKLIKELTLEKKRILHSPNIQITEKYNQIKSQIENLRNEITQSEPKTSPDQPMTYGRK